MLISLLFILTDRGRFYAALSELIVNGGAIILFMVLIGTSNGDSNVQVIKAAILGSILANLLLCLGTW